MKSSTTIIKNRLMKKVPSIYFPLMDNVAKSLNGWKEFLSPLEDFIDKCMLEAYIKGSKSQWIDPVETNKLPSVGEKVLFHTGGKTYYGTFTENDFFKEGQGAASKLYDACDCVWMYLPQYKDKKQ